MRRVSQVLYIDPKNSNNPLQRKLVLIFVKLSLNGKEVLCLPGAVSRTRTYARRSYPSCFGALVAIIIAKGKLQPNVPSDTPISIIPEDKLYREPNNILP